MAQANVATIQNCMVQGHQLHNANIKNSTLTRVEISNSTISDSTVINCRISESSMYNSKFFDSVIKGAKALLKCELQRTQVTPSAPTLCKLPIELQEMIFEYCLDWKGKTPVLVAAVRGHKELYPQVLGVFCRINAFTVDENNWDITEHMSVPAFRSIKKLMVTCPRWPFFRYTFPDIQEELTFSELTIRLGVDAVYFFCCDEHDQEKELKLAPWVGHIAEKSPFITKLTLEWNVVCIMDGWDDPNYYASDMKSLTDSVNFLADHLGGMKEVVSNLDKTVENHDHTVESDSSTASFTEYFKVWVWEAEEGEALTWKE
ncbi:hypothetical protein B7494_g3686 [Chlorociboria aeruginascens]|nr:hypothetical protein B7494_g3686 [Chlorociboria aeruginascens]